MSVDTAEKRFSMINLGSGGPQITMPIPAAPVSDAERYHRLGLYAGISMVPPVGTADEYIYFARHRLRR